MKTTQKIRIFALVTALLMMILCVGVCATDAAAAPEVSENEGQLDHTETTGTADEKDTEEGKLDQNMSGADMSMSERFGYALQGTATGMLMVFAVLTLLAIIVAITGKLLGPKSAKKVEKKMVKESTTAVPESGSPRAFDIPAPQVAPVESVQDDRELAAVITAAIAAMIESGDYKNEFVGGFRVVSFKRSSTGAWNRK